MPSINETQLEQTFADMASAHLRDKSNTLLDYLLGFQLMKSEDDGKRAVGFFGFEIDGKIYYAPAFFLNGEIRGLESLYAVKADLFMPLTDDWVNDLVNKADVDIGAPNNAGRRARGVSEPDYTRLTVIPGGVNVKLGSAADLDVKLGSGPMNMEPGRGSVMSFPEQLRGLPYDAQVKIANDIRSRPELYDAVMSFYSYTDVLPAAPVQEKTAASGEKPLLLVSEVTDEGVDQLTDEQREEVLSGGIVAIDKRPEVDKARLYKSETTRDLLTPSDNALYDILMADGSIEPCLVLNVGRRQAQYLVYGTDSKKWCVSYPENLHAVRKYLDTAFREWADAAPKASAARTNDIVAFASLEGHGTIPYQVHNRTQGLDGSIVLKVSPHSTAWAVADGDESRSYPHFPSDRNTRTEAVNDVCQIIITPEKTSVPLYYRGKLVISDKHFRLIRLGRDSTNQDDLVPAAETTPRNYRCSDFGDYNTVWTQLEKVSQALDAWVRDGEVYFKYAGEVTSHVTPRSVYDFLLGTCGIDKTAADELLAEIAEKRGRYYIKEARDPRIELPEVSEAVVGGEMSRHHLTSVPQVLSARAPSEDNRGVYNYESPFTEPEAGSQENTLQRIQAAVQTGDREVFDAAALSSLIKSYVPTDLVDRYVPSITVGMDRLGRILFLIYWHYNDFAERYGDDELADMLDNLSTVFQQLGDMLLSLKKRTLAGDPEHFGLGLDSQLETQHD